MQQTASLNKRDGFHQYKLPSNKLTNRESQIFDMVVHGKEYSEIAELLGISKRTVVVHITAIHQKIGVRGSKKLVALNISDRLAAIEAKLDLILSRLPGQQLNGCK